jgi:hypothetical protein
MGPPLLLCQATEFERNDILELIGSVSDWLGARPTDQ